MRLLRAQHVRDTRHVHTDCMWPCRVTALRADESAIKVTAASQNWVSFQNTNGEREDGKGRHSFRSQACGSRLQTLPLQSLLLLSSSSCSTAHTLLPFLWSYLSIRSLSSTSIGLVTVVQLTYLSPGFILAGYLLSLQLRPGHILLSFV